MSEENRNGVLFAMYRGSIQVILPRQCGFKVSQPWIGRRFKPPFLLLKSEGFDIFRREAYHKKELYFLPCGGAYMGGKQSAGIRCP